MIAALTTNSVAAGPRQVDPKELTESERKALRIVNDYAPLRGPGGYGNTIAGRVSLAMASKLTGLGLARPDYAARGGIRLVLTGAGVNTIAVMTARRERRGGAQ